ncbi:MAG: Ig-like domain-containing protein [Vicinamibacterales bacterium]
MILTRRWAFHVFVCLGVVAGTASSALAQLPAPWVNRDIGSPSAAGSAAESAGTFTVRGGGSDIWYSSDQFQFVYQSISGDVDIRAQVTAVQYIDQWTKAGVMIRETLGSTSRHASTFVTPAKGLAFQRRVTTGEISTHTTGGSATAPYWVRLVRVGQLFTSYVSANGTSWALVGSETISMAATVQVGLAVTSHQASSSAMATFTNVTVSGPATTPPPPSSAWTNRDVGSPALAGRSSESNGTFSVTGAGSDIWESSDQFQFMYQLVDGDLEIVARLNDLEYAHAWSKGGVMIRQSLSASAAHAFMAGTPGKGWAFQRRPVSGGISVHSPGSFATPPGWVRLVRQGDLFTAYESTNGTNWVIVGTETIPMASSVYVGLAVTSHNTGMTSTATFTNVAIKRSTSSTNASPSVTLLAPANGTTYSAPGAVTFSASASGSNGSITKVGFYANGDIVATDTTSPYSVTWGPVPAGTYNLYAVATDDKGATGTSATVTVTVGSSTNSPPTSAITSPANGATFIAPATITIAASASDSNGSITRVDFLRGSTLISSDTSAPYSVTWNNVAAGTYSLTAVAYDNGGASTASAAVSVNVTTTTTVTPTTLMFAPSADHATMVTSYSVALRRSTDSVSATPVATKNLGKPSPVNNEISVDISDIVNPLAAGSYYAVVTATGSGGSAASAPSATFTK